MAFDPITDGSLGFAPPVLTQGMNFSDYGSYGLRQFSGWVREEFLKDLVGREGARLYREMSDNNPTVGALLFAIKQAIRKVEWRVEPAGDGAAAKAEAEFVEGLMEDMSHTWEDFVDEALSMLQYGYAPCEIVYKRRNGTRPESRPGPKPQKNMASSKFNDGRIGWRRLPIRGQDTVIKWFFDENGQTRGLTQQPWVGMLIDIPIEKLLLFRASAHKNNPEGRSVLRNSYRPYFFQKRLEEQEAVMMERMNGFPVLYVPSELIDAAGATGPGGAPSNAQAYQSLQQYKKIVTNLRVDEQMGAVLPSDVYTDLTTGRPSTARMFELHLLTPGAGGGSARGGLDSEKIITRYKIDIMTTVLADFIQMGHEVRGTNNLASTKVDMFYAAIEGWCNNIAAVVNRYGIDRIWRMNGIDDSLKPEIKPDMPQSVDLDGVGGFIANLAAAGMPLFPDEELQNYLRDMAGFPEDMGTAEATVLTADQQLDAKQSVGKPGVADKIKKAIFAEFLNKYGERFGAK